MGRVREVLYPHHRIGIMERAEHQKGSSTSQGAPTSADDAVSFKDSDMWTAVKCGTGSVSLKSKKTGASTVAIVDLGEMSPTQGAAALGALRSAGLCDAVLSVRRIAGRAGRTVRLRVRHAAA